MLDKKIQNVQTIDGKNIEIAIKDGVIVNIGSKIVEAARETISFEAPTFISAGWIDDHVHCFEEMDLYYDYPDEIGYKKGCTTVIDAGSTGANNIEKFYQLAKNSKTNVFALINISKTGIVKQNELADLSDIDRKLIKEMIANYPDFILGIKARMSKSVIGDNGMKPLQIAKKIQEENNQIPLMIHIGSNPPKLEAILEHLTKGDILTHCFNGKENGIYDSESKQIKNVAWDALKRGVIFDIGHGTDSFNFKVAKQAFNEGMNTTSISTDIYIRNRKNGPVFDMATTLDKLHYIGYSWQDIINKITTVPAESFHLSRKGQLKIGYDADFTFFKIIDEDKQLIDSNGNSVRTKQVIVPVKVMIGGHVYECSL